MDNEGLGDLLHVVDDVEKLEVDHGVLAENVLPFGSGVGASVDVEIFENTRDGFEETQSAALHLLQIQLLDRKSVV